MWVAFLGQIGKPTGGRELLGKLSGEACHFYLEELSQSHPEIVKAACYAFGELINKVPESEKVIHSHYHEILDKILEMARHENPTVRATCFGVLDSLAIKCPDESRKRMGELLDVGFFQISFNFKAEETAESIGLYLFEMYKAFQMVRAKR